MSSLIPRHLWDSFFEELVDAHPQAQRGVIALARPDGTCFHHPFKLLPHEGEMRIQNEQYSGRTLKALLWLKGGSFVHLVADKELVDYLSGVFSNEGARQFDADIMGRQLCGETLRFVYHEREDSLPIPQSTASALGRNLERCRIGFDLGGSDRKTAAVIDGKVVFSEEVP